MSQFSNKPLKGMLDEYPEQMAVFNYIRKGIAKVADRFSYQEYDAPVMEPLGIFAAKSSEELIKEQSYSFTDRGKRDLILRPEMTPSLARMISKIINEKPRPYRWFSIPKCYRYERPQKGRLREFRQLNFDLIGDQSIFSDLEILRLISSLMNEFNVPLSHFQIKYNNRALMQATLINFNFSENEIKVAYKLIDKKDKMSDEDFEKCLQDDFSIEKIKVLNDLLKIDSLSAMIDFGLDKNKDKDLISEQKAFLELLSKQNLSQQVVFSPTTVRGLDYYTGLVFEVYDTGGELNRALFGGGRYDNLLGLFSKESISGIGFGMGIYIFTIFLTQYGLLDENLLVDQKSSYFICSLDQSTYSYALKVADKLRSENKNIEVSFTFGNIKKQFNKAEQKKHQFIIILGDEEEKSLTYTVKDLKSGEKTTHKL